MPVIVDLSPNLIPLQGDLKAHDASLRLAQRTVEPAPRETLAEAFDHCLSIMTPVQRKDLLKHLQREKAESLLTLTTPEQRNAWPDVGWKSPVLAPPR